MSPEFIAYNYFNDLLNVQWLKWEQQHPPANLPLKIHCGGRSQDGGGIGRVITFSSAGSLKEQQNGEQSLQDNFWSLAADIGRPERQSIVFEGR